MISTIYWILAILVMLVLLITTVYGLIDRIRTNKEFKRSKQKTFRIFKQTNRIIK